MGLKRYLKKLLNCVLKFHGHQILESSLLYDWQKSSQIRTCYKESSLTEEAAIYLQQNHPRLKNLKERYALINNDVTVPLAWTDDHVTPNQMKYFRGDNAYVWQLRGQNMNILGYVLATYYVKSIDTFGLLDKLIEDDYFGINTFLIDNKIISRDLLDSIMEIYFLERNLNISSHSRLNILDIGAGYGRLAHRMLNGFPNIASYICTDAFAVSTFISEYYIRFRGFENRANVVALDEIENVLETHNVDIAVNIHSFSECTLVAIEWWLFLLKKNRIKYLMIVPNSKGFQTKGLFTKNGLNFQEIIEKNCYKLVVEEPKYRDLVVQKYAIVPTYYYLFELQ